MDHIIYQINIETRKVENEFKTRRDAVLKFPNFLGLNSTIGKCLNGKQDTTYGFIWVYKGILGNTTINDYIKLKVPNLIIDTHPHLTKEWNISNTENINLITYGSGQEIIWNCLADETHPSYNVSLKERTKPNHPTGCPECHRIKYEVHDRKEKELHILNHISNTNKIDTGDATERYIVNLLKNSKNFLKVIKIGETGDQTDIVVTLVSGIQKSLQIKTLSERKQYQYTYNIYIRSDYPDNMLIVCANAERNHFSIFPFSKFGIKNLTLSFKSGNTIYEDIMYRNEKSFLDKLIDEIPNSCDYEMYCACKEKMLERYMLIRLEAWCIKNGFIFKRNDTDGNTIDCCINGIHIQAKYCSLNKTNSITYQISCHKACGSLNGKGIRVPCCVTDPFEYVIVEVGGIRNIEKKEHIYEEQFCFIPKNVLADRKILAQLPDIKGAGNFSICPPDYQNDHWSKKFWNNHPFVQKTRLN